MADEITKTTEDQTKSRRNFIDSLKKEKKSVDDQRAETEALIDISKTRRGVLQGLVDVSGDLKITEKDHLTAKKAVLDQVKGAGMSIVQGAEGFVTGMFGGPIGGIINSLSMGFITRMIANNKQDAETSKALQKKKDEEAALFDKRVSITADTLMKDKEYAKLGRERVEAEIENKLIDDERAALKLKEKEQLKATKAFMEGKTQSPESKKEAEKNNGAVVPIVDDVEGEGEVTASEGMSLDTTNLLLTDIEEHLQFIVDNTEETEEREEWKRKQAAKKAGGKVDIKKEDDEGFSFMGLMGTIIGAISGALLGAVAGLTLGFIGMWKDIFKFIGGKLAKMFPDVTKMLGDIFGKGGKLSKFFTSIKLFFTQNKAFKVISDLIDTVKGAITKALKPVKAAFTSIKTGFTTFFNSIKNAFKMITGPIDSIKKMLGVGAKAGGGAGGAMGFLKGFKTFFKIFSKFFAQIFKPLQIIISLVEGFFEAKDAASKSEGMLATFFNSIIGFFGGVLDGLIFGMLDLIKDGISWIAGFLGFEQVESFLDSFSFSDMFNEFLDDIYAWFNTLFSDPVKALTDLFAGYFGAALSVGDFILDMLKKPFVWIMSLFGWDDAAEATEKFSL